MEKIALTPLGLNTDQPPHLLGPEVWSAGSNIVFDDQRTRKAPGYEVLQPATLFLPLQLIYTSFNDQDYWVYVGNDGVGVFNNTDHFDITPATWLSPIPGEATICLINNVVVVNNPVTEPYFWDGVTSNIMLPLPGWDALPTGSIADVMISNLYHLFALNMTENSVNFAGNRVRWSDVAQPGTVPGEWEVLLTNQASFIDIPTPEGKIIGGLTMREDLMVYKERSTHVFRYIGGTFVYELHTVFETTGMLARHCVVELDGTHIVVTQDDIIRHDGVNVDSLVEKQVKRAIFDNLNKELAHHVFLHLDKSHEEIWVGFPTLTAIAGCNALLVYNYTDKTWTLRYFAKEFFDAAVGNFDGPGTAGAEWDLIPLDTWQDWIGTWNNASSVAQKNTHLMAGADNELWHLGVSTLNGGEEFAGFVEKISMDLGHIDIRKRVTRVWPKFQEGSGNTVYISVGMSESEFERPTWTAQMPFVIGTDRSIPVNVEGRAFAFRVEDNGDAPVWSLTGFDIEFRLGGRF